MSIKTGGFAFQWLGNVDMHMFAKCIKIIPLGSKVMNILLTGNGWTNGQTYRGTNILIKVQTQGSCNLVSSIHSGTYCIEEKLRANCVTLYINNYNCHNIY